MTVTIELSEEQAANLKAKAAARGLSLERWFEQLAAQQTPPDQTRARRVRYNLAELIAQCDTSAPLSAEDRAWIDAPPVGREAL